MARGGKRPGAGRPKGQKAQKTANPEIIGKAPAAAGKPPAKIKHENIKPGPRTRGGARPGAGRPKVVGAQPKSSPRAPDDSASLRHRIALCASAGMDAPTIAAALGIDEASLRIDFAHELANGTAIVRADNLAALSAAAKDGNAAAAKALLAIADKVGPSCSAPTGSSSAGRGDAATRALRILQGGKK